MSRFDQTQTGYNPSKIGMPLVLKWQYSSGRSDNTTTPPSVANGVCYFAMGAVVYAVDTNTGSLKWRYPKESTLGGAVRTTPLIYNNTVFFGANDGKLYSLKAATGQMNWIQTTPGSIRCSPVLTDSGLLLVGGDDRSVRAFDPVNGDPIWTKPFYGSDDAGVGLAVSSGVIVISCLDGQVYGINLGNGRTKWTYRLSYPPTNTSPVIIGDLVLASSGNRIVALTVRSGQPRWTYTLPESDLAGTPAYAGSDMYIVAADGKVYSYTLGQKQPQSKWGKPVDIGQRCSAGPLVCGDKVFVAGNQGLVVALSAADGRVLWRYTSIAGIQDYRIEQESLRSPLVAANGSLYLIGTDGVLSCFQQSFPDSEPPVAMAMFPPDQSSVSGMPPLSFSVVVYDQGSGVDPDRTVLTLEGKPLAYEFDNKKSLLTYTIKASKDSKQVPGMPDGKKVLNVRGVDYSGNVMNKEWTFIVDSTLPPPVKGLPETPKAKPSAPTTQPGRPGTYPGGGFPGGPGGGFPGGGPGGGGMPPPPPGGMGMPSGPG